MFDNFTYFNWLVVAGSLGGFFGTLLAWLINYTYKNLTEKGDLRIILDGILISFAMGFVGGALTWGLSLFDDNSLADESINATFLLMFLPTLFSASLDTSFALIKKASSAIFNSD